MSVYFYSLFNFPKYIYIYLYDNVYLPQLDKKNAKAGQNALIVAELIIYGQIFKDLNTQSYFHLYPFEYPKCHSAFELSDFSYPFFILAF